MLSPPLALLPARKWRPPSRCALPPPVPPGSVLVSVLALVASVGSRRWEVGCVVSPAAAVVLSEGEEVVALRRRQQAPEAALQRQQHPLLLVQVCVCVRLRQVARACVLRSAWGNVGGRQRLTSRWLEPPTSGEGVRGKEASDDHVASGREGGMGSCVRVYECGRVRGVYVFVRR